MDLLTTIQSRYWSPCFRPCFFLFPMSEAELTVQRAKREKTPDQVSGLAQAPNSILVVKGGWDPQG